MTATSQAIHHSEVITREHFQIHKNLSYSTYLNGTLNSGSNLSINFTTPNTNFRVHIIPLVSSSGESTFEVLESPTITDDSGAALMLYNRRRESTGSSDITTIESSPSTGSATSGATITGSGTIIWIDMLGQGQNKQAGGNRDIGEWVLNKNTDYSFRITSSSNNNLTNLQLVWYETDIV